MVTRLLAVSPHRTVRAVYGTLLGLIALVHVSLIVPGFVLTRVWEDEAYNLTVPLNLLRGLGYASDGILTTGMLDPFDVRISTGPVVLLPIAAVLTTGVDPIVGARAVMAVFSLGALVAIFVTARRFSGPWGALVALIAALGLNAARYLSPLQGPTDVLGEWPTVLFTVLAVLFVGRRPALAGLMLGLALQCKNLGVLSLPVLLIAVIVASGGRVLVRARRLVLFGIALVIPTVLFEIAKLVSLGLDEYIRSTRAFIFFLRTGGQTGFSVPYGDKIAYTLGSWFVPAVIAVLVVALCAAALAVTAFDRLRRPVGASSRTERTEPEVLVHVLVCTGILVSWLAWWTLSTKDPLWIRHPAPGLLVAVPLLAAASTCAGIALFARGGGRRVLGAAALIGVVLVSSVQLIARPIQAWTPQFETLAQQREAATQLSRLPGAVVRGQWGALPVIALMAGKRAVLADRAGLVGAPWLIETLDPSPEARERQREQVSSLCGPDLIRTSGYVFCLPSSE